MFLHHSHHCKIHILIISNKDWFTVRYISYKDKEVIEEIKQRNMIDIIYMTCNKQKSEENRKCNFLPNINEGELKLVLGIWKWSYYVPWVKRYKVRHQFYEPRANTFEITKIFEVYPRWPLVTPNDPYFWSFVQEDVWGLLICFLGCL